MTTTATVRNTGVSVKKVKPVIDLIRGKNVNEALRLLQFLTSPIAFEVSKLLKSANANAENNSSIRSNSLKISKIYANEGQGLKRFRARARGRADRIIKRNSHITVELSE